MESNQQQKRKKKIKEKTKTKKVVARTCPRSSSSDSTTPEPRNGKKDLKLERKAREIRSREGGRGVGGRWGGWGGEGWGGVGEGRGKNPSLKRLIRPNQSLSLESVFTSLFAESPDGRQRMPDESRNWMELFRGSMIDSSCTTITLAGPPGQRGRRRRRDCQLPPPCLRAKLKRPPVV